MLAPSHCAGGVLSIVWTSSSRRQQSASTTPRTTVAGRIHAAGWIAARAITSSVRFTTAARERRLRWCWSPETV